MMDEDRFWGLIEESRTGIDPGEVEHGDAFQDRQAERLCGRLRQLSPEEVAGFAMRFSELEGRAYAWPLWGAAYWLHGGCGDDGFMDFRANLISLGREWYSRALEDPDFLAELVDRADVPYMQGEGFQYHAGRVYQELTGHELPVDGFPEGPAEPSGVGWDFESAEEARRRFPRLYARYPEMGD